MSTNIIPIFYPKVYLSIMDTKTDQKVFLTKIYFIRTEKKFTPSRPHNDYILVRIFQIPLTQLLAELAYVHL